MPAPTFSILIPTRDRPATLRHALATVAAQAGDDYEIVVADNCGGPETREIATAVGGSRLRYVRSDEVLPMADNWERGLAACSGEYVTVLGDDDGLTLSCLEVARRLVGAVQPEIISWSPHTYWWPDTIVPWYRNLLFVNMANGAREMDSRAVLRDFYAGTGGFGGLPMIYNAFFHRSLIEEARRRYDGFFTPREAAPDIASGILGLHLTGSHLLSTRPLSIRGNSGRSNGTAQWARSLGAKVREAYFREERARLDQLIHPSLIPSPHLLIIEANAKLRCRDAYFPDDAELDVDRGLLLQALVHNLNFEPEAYEDNLGDARALAAKLGVALPPEAIPARQPRERKRTWGTFADEQKVVVSVDGDAAGLRTIEDATRLVEGLMPPVDDYGR